MEPLEKLFYGVFFLVIGIVSFRMIHGMIRNRMEEQGRKLTVAAQVISKRIESLDAVRQAKDHACACCYATFRESDGTMLELNLSDREYELLSEGARGKLTFQGSRYLRFVSR